MNPLLMFLVLAIGLSIFGHTMFRKIKLLTALEPTDRANHLTERLMALLTLAVGQKRLIGRKKKKEVQASCMPLFSGDSVCY